MTLSAASCLLLTQDSALARKLALAVGGLAEIRATPLRQEWARPRGTLQVPLLDLRHPEAPAALAGAGPEMRRGTIVFGVPGSDPFLACHGADLFSVESLEVDPEHLRNTLHHAVLLHQAQEEVSLLREERGLAPADIAPVASPTSHLAPLHELWRASRHVHDVQKLLDQLVEGIASSMGLARVGLFVRLHDETAYRLWAGLRCLDRAGSLSVDPMDPFVGWLEHHAHLVCREHLSHIRDLRHRRLLQQMLDDLGAEIIAPLMGKRGLLGWLLAGHRVTGVPFTSMDLSDLTVISEQSATLLENAVLVEELAVQKTLAENLLEAIPTGILAVSEEGSVRWFSRAAEDLLGVSAADVVDRPVERVCSRVADLALRTIREETSPESSSWTDPASRRTIRAESFRMGDGAEGRGCMLLFSDITRERLWHEKQEELERHAFWNDLAAAMSHEVRNPLVAISTFAQLLPERYGDAEFRQQFFNIVTGEVARLNSIITQINTFAHPPQPVFRPTDPGAVADRACSRAEALLGSKLPGLVREVENGLVPFLADVDALADALAHLLVNAQEAVQDRSPARIVLLVRKTGAEPEGGLVFAVSDSGPGIPPVIREKLFSPFCTTKPRGLGLGLPLARRSAVDHGGRVDVESTAKGTTVTITLPLGGRANHAETPDRG